MNPDSRYKPPCPSKSPTPTRELEASGTSRSPVFLDDETLQRMIESFGPIDYNQIAGAVSPEGPTDPDLFGAMPWHQTEMQWDVQQDLSKRKSKSPPGVEPDRRLLSQPQAADEVTDQGAVEARKESIMEWFDRSVQKQLEALRDNGSPTGSPVDPALAPLKAKHALNLSKGTAERMAEASASRVEIGARLETDFTTELTDAVEKLAKAETMSHYTEALQAAEEAAQNAPPELVEQAAAAEAKRIQTELSKVKETIPGTRPIEVVGYVGITKPYKPKKPN